jgi:hypothetical protein
MVSRNLARLKKLEEILSPVGRWFVISIKDDVDDEDAHIEAERSRLIRDEGMTGRDKLVIIRLRWV